MSSARKFLALALASCRAKQYEEAGIFLAQAAQDEGAEALAAELGSNAVENEAGNGLPETPETPTEVDEKSDDSEKDEEAEDKESEEEPRPIIVASDAFDWDDDEDDEVSVSSVTRRKSTSLSQVGKILAASMSVVDDGEEDGEDGEDEYAESDPDIPGVELIPASFSSVQVKSVAVKSPVKLQT